MLIIRKCTQEVQFDLLAGRVGFIIRHAQKVVIIILRLAVTHLLHVEVYAPGPHLGSVDMRHAASHQRLQVWRSNHLSVHGDGQVVVPLHSNRCLLVRQREGPQVQCSLFSFKFFLVIFLFWDRLEAINVVLAK